MPRKASITDLRERKVTGVGVEGALAQWNLNRTTMGVDWKNVSAASFRTALALCMSEGVYLAFSPVQGGLGVCLTVFMGETKKKVYANNADDLNLLLEQLIDLLQPSSIDARAIYAGGSD